MKSFLSLRNLNPISIIRRKIESVEVQDSQVAERICKLIPARCPFKRKIYFAGHLLVYIPPLCQLNPFYRQLIMLRLRALAYLAEVSNGDLLPVPDANRDRTSHRSLSEF